MNTPDLPPLPEPFVPLYGDERRKWADQMRAYGDARAAAERERMNAHAVVLAETARVVERERCAKLCDRTGNDHCAAAIRAEPKKEQQP